jgi:hypothetical protein
VLCGGELPLPINFRCVFICWKVSSFSCDGNVIACFHAVIEPGYKLSYISGRGLFGFAKKLSRSMLEITFVSNNYFPKSYFSRRRTIVFIKESLSLVALSILFWKA